MRQVDEHFCPDMQQVDELRGAIYLLQSEMQQVNRRAADMQQVDELLLLCCAEAV